MKFDSVCEHCSQVILRRVLANGNLEQHAHYKIKRFCTPACAFEFSRGKTVREYSGPNDYSYFHKLARQACPPGRCVDCGTQNPKDVHHVDSNHKNNDPKNLVRICRSCHMKRHRGGRKCTLCDLPHASLGYCMRHYYSFKRYGDPMRVSKTAHGNAK